jgi:hypothetical protein
MKCAFDCVRNDGSHVIGFRFLRRLTAKQCAAHLLSAAYDLLGFNPMVVRGVWGTVYGLQFHLLTWRRGGRQAATLGRWVAAANKLQYSVRQTVYKPYAGLGRQHTRSRQCWQGFAPVVGSDEHFQSLWQGVVGGQGTRVNYVSGTCLIRLAGLSLPASCLGGSHVYEVGLTAGAGVCAPSC